MKRWQTVVASLVVLITVLSGTLVLADTDGPEEDSIASGTPVFLNGTRVMRVYYPDLKMAHKIFISFEAQVLETNYEEGYHVMEVTQGDIARLTDAGLRVEIDNEWQAPQPPPAQISAIPGYPCYRTVEETFASAQSIAANYPNLATWTDVGNSWEKTTGLGGYDIMVLRLTNSAISGPKPKLFITAAIHAREYTTAELVTRFAEYLVSNYGTDADATWLLDHHEIHLILHTNPDGRKQAETGLLWRKNTNQNYCSPTSNYRGADLNRNFSFQWGCCGGSSGNQCSQTYRGPSPASEPETQAVQDYVLAQFPDQRGPDQNDPAPDDATGVYIDVHSYSELVLWPWGFTSTPTGNGTQLQTLGRKFAYWNGYTPEQAIGLYPTDGTTDDFVYGELGVAAYTFELGTAFFQACSTFENTILPDNRLALIYAAKVARTPYMTPAGPDVYNLSLSNDSVPTGTPVTLSGTIDDTRYNNSEGTEPTQNITAAEYYVAVPPWVADPTPVPIAMSPSDGNFDSSVENVAATVDTTGLSEGQHIIFVRGQDANGNWGAFSAIFLNITGNTPPTICDLPDQIFDESTSLPGTIDLWACVGDAETPTDELTCTIEGTPPAGAGVTLDDCYYVTINPSADWCGWTDVTIRVTDSGGLWDSDTFRVAVTWSCPGPIEPPGVPVLVAPVDGSAVGGNRPTFEWGAVTGADEYQIQVDDNTDFSSPQREKTTASTEYTPASGLSGGVHYWRVRASNGCGAGTWSARQEFTVLTPSPPGFEIYLPVVARDYR